MIPTRNRRLLVERAVASAKAQSWRNLEIVVVDDASVDGTCELLALDPTVVVVRNAEPRGAAAARNIGARVGTGDLIAFLDSDDEWCREKLERQVATFESDTGGEIGLVHCDMVLADGRSLTPVRGRLATGHCFEALLALPTIPSTSTYCVRRSVFEAVGGFDEELQAYQDRDLLLRVAERSRIHGVPEILVAVHRDAATPRMWSSRSTAAGGEQLLRKWSSELDRRPKTHSTALARVAGGCLVVGDRPRARRLLHRALRRCPWSPTAWRYILVWLAGPVAPVIRRSVRRVRDRPGS